MARTFFDLGLDRPGDIRRDAITTAEALAMTVYTLVDGTRGVAATGAITWAIGIVADRTLVRAFEEIGGAVSGLGRDAFRDAIDAGRLRPLAPVVRRPDGATVSVGEHRRRRAEQAAMVRTEAPPKHRERRRIDDDRRE